MKTINLDEYKSVTLKTGRVLLLESEDRQRAVLFLPRSTVVEDVWKQRVTLKFGPVHRPTLALTSSHGRTRAVMQAIINEVNEKTRALWHDGSGTRGIAAVAGGGD